MTTAIAHTFNDVDIRQRPDDGYVDATAMCQANGKQFNDYSRLDTTQAFLEALSLKTGIPVIKNSKSAEFPLLETKPGRYGGTWVHPKVAIHLGQWCNPEFAVFVTELVFAWMTGNTQPPTSSLDFRALLIDSDLKPAELRVLALLDQSQDEGMDYAAMGQRLGMNRSTVFRAMARLTDLGLVQVDRRVKYRVLPLPANPSRN